MHGFYITDDLQTHPYQDPTFSSDIGSPNPAFFAFMPALEFDSFLTVGEQGSTNTMSQIGIDFSGWTSTHGISGSDAGCSRFSPGPEIDFYVDSEFRIFA